MKRTKTTGKKKKPQAEPAPPRPPFAIELINKLAKLNGGKIDSGELSDKSSFWVDYKIKNKILSFSFDSDMSTLQGVAMYREIKEVTGQKKIFGK